MSTPPSSPPRSAPEKFHPYPCWAPRFWHGMTFLVWLRVLLANRFAVSPSRWPMAFAITLVSLFNSCLALLQRLCYGSRPDRVDIPPPLFIVGHWRSGTTFLHELLVLDDRFTFPTTYQCFAPSHFLVSDWFIPRFLKFLLPSKRPMDNVAAGWGNPQEDEFALCNLGLGSPYLIMAFPNGDHHQAEYLELQTVPAAHRSRWEQGFRWFLRRVAYRNPRPIVLKSPPHTARIGILLRLFPTARFVHIVRDPEVLFPSTLRLWKSLIAVQGLQVDRGQDRTEYVLDAFTRMYDSFFRDWPDVPPTQRYELRYEDLVQNPTAQLQALYEHLNLPDFEHVRPQLAATLVQNKEYRTNRYELPPETKALVASRWGEYARRYGYQVNDCV